MTTSIRIPEGFRKGCLSFQLCEMPPEHLHMPLALYLQPVPALVEASKPNGTRCAMENIFDLLGSGARRTATACSCTSREPHRYSMSPRSTFAETTLHTFVCCPPRRQANGQWESPRLSCSLILFFVKRSSSDYQPHLPPPRNQQLSFICARPKFRYFKLYLLPTFFRPSHSDGLTCRHDGTAVYPPHLLR